MANPAIVLKTVTASADFPFAADPDYTALIGSVTSAWYCSKPELLTLNELSRITAALNRSTSLATIVPSAAGPTFSTSGFGADNRPSANFPTNRYLDIADCVPLASDFSIACVFKASAGSNGRYLFRTKGDPYAEMLISSDNRLTARVGNASVFARPLTGTNFIAGQVVAAVLAWDNTTKTTSMSVDGGKTWIEATNVSVAALANGDLRIGSDLSSLQGAIADITDVIVYPVSLRKVANAGALSNLKSYFLDRYALT